MDAPSEARRLGPRLISTKIRAVASTQSSIPDLNPYPAQAKKAMVEELSKTAKANKLKGFEFVRAVHLDDEPWTPENNLLTPSLKVKRPQLKSKYEAELKQLYKDLKSGRK